MNKRNIEIRSFGISNDAESRLVSGYAVVFNSCSQVLYDRETKLYFREIIRPEAITQELLDSSDVVMNYAHDDNMILARSRYGEGTLHLRLDDHGLFFSFEMPDTSLGNQVMESIHRGDITACSFKFSIDEDNCDIWEQGDDVPLRTILKITGLYDCAIVTHPAYEDTSVSARSLDKLNTLKDDMNKDELELREEEIKNPEDEKQEDEKQEEPQEEKSCTDEEEREEAPEEEETTEEPEEEQDEEEKEDEDEDEPEEERKMNKNTQNIQGNFRTMEKRFSLLNAIRDIANGNKLSAAEQAVVNKGAEIMRNAGTSFSGQIQLPVAELRADEPVHYTVEADGEHVVVTDYLSILEPLKAKNVLVKAGATYMTGLKGNVQIPIASDVNAYWEGEITKAQNGAGSFSHINMAPHRLAVEVPISKQFIVQDTLGAENLIRKLIVEKINDKLEATILSDDAAAGNVPAGIFYNVTPKDITSYKDICNLESTLEENNFNTGNFKYIVNPKAKAGLRSMLKGTNATGMVWEDNEIDGTPVDWTTHLDNYQIAYGNWEDLYIGQWGALDITVDPYTLSGDGQIRIVVNAFFDYKVVRDGAIVLGEYNPGE